MKNVLLLSFLLLISCSTIPQSIKRYDLDGFSHDGNTFYLHNQPIARVQAITFSLDGLKLVKEINLLVLNPQELNRIPSLIRYVYESHKTSEVEVELCMDQK